MSLPDVAGLAGVFLILVAYVAAAMGRLDAKQPISLLANLVGASLVLFSLLAGDFNLSATVMESIWALTAAYGLLRWAFMRMRR
jgi:hypothetical protein